MPTRRALYIGSTDLDTYLPGLRAENDLALDAARWPRIAPLASIWIGNRTIASAHYDMSNNIACCVVGRRRFTLFPPDQVAQSLSRSAGADAGRAGRSAWSISPRPISTAIRASPRRWRAAQVAELEPGDVLFYPALWWHHVEALDAFNVLVNYWWNAAPAFIDTPMNDAAARRCSACAIGPTARSAAWRALFDYYVFGPADRAGRASARGGARPAGAARRSCRRGGCARMLLNRLNR